MSAAALGVNHRQVRAGVLPLGRLHRSGDVTAFTADQARVLVGEHGVRTIVDLRSDSEVSRYGPPAALQQAGARWLRLPLTGYPRDVIADRRPTGPQRVAYFHGILSCSAPGCWPGLIRSLAAVADRPFLITCHFGKDRTGVTVACLLSLVGASVDEICADYAAGNADLAAQIDRFRDKWERKGHSREDYLTRMRLSPDTMRWWLAEVTERYGSVPDALLAQGVAERHVDRLRAGLSPAGTP